MTTEKQFLIDLVRITAVLRVAAFTETRITNMDIARQVGQPIDRVEYVLRIALTTDFRDEQLELLVSLIDFTDTNDAVLNLADARFIRNAYPPLALLADLLGEGLPRLQHLHHRDRETLAALVKQCFSAKLEAWVASNLANVTALNLAEPANACAPQNNYTDNDLLSKITDRYGDAVVIGHL